MPSEHLWCNDKWKKGVNSGVQKEASTSQRRVETDRDNKASRNDWQSTCERTVNKKPNDLNVVKRFPPTLTIWIEQTKEILNLYDCESASEVSHWK